MTPSEHLKIYKYLQRTNIDKILSKELDLKTVLQDSIDVFNILNTRRDEEYNSEVISIEEVKLIDELFYMLEPIFSDLNSINTQNLLNFKDTFEELEYQIEHLDWMKMCKKARLRIWAEEDFNYQE